jgi:HSP20 family protein
MERMVDEMGRWRWPSWMERWPSSMEEEEGSFAPAVEVSESDEEVSVKAQVPGLKREDIEVELLDGSLSIKGEAKEEKEEKKKSYYRREFSYGQFARRISLPSGVDTRKASAELKNGVLNVRIPKTEEAKKQSVKLEIK